MCRLCPVVSRRSLVLRIIEVVGYLILFILCCHIANSTSCGCTQDLRRGTQCTSFLSFLELIVITPRIATDLNLHQVSTTQPQTERQEREMLNRARVCMICMTGWTQ
ncbi:hypothetical protein EV424DRAFT_873193 [Suillus variegatus]|nr:hypothetical protein EV424DRAFT_873193 [Suillus variegatus]